MSWCSSPGRAGFGGVLIACAERGLFVANCLRPSVAAALSLVAPVLNRACEVSVTSFQHFLVAHMGTGAVCCCGLVVVSYWPCYSGQHLAVGLPWGFLIAFPI